LAVRCKRFRVRIIGNVCDLGMKAVSRDPAGSVHFVAR
jgi:hypothetical protein